jgi:arsenite methyltransferase
MATQRQTSTAPGLQFDEAASRIEAMYRTPDVVAQRRAMLRVLAPLPGERVLDVGCGPGFLAVELAEAVGAEGRVWGIDSSPVMLALAGSRCSAVGFSDRVELHGADARHLPFPDGHFDAAVAAITYGFVSDVPAALAELYRVLRPGGRALVADTDWGSLVWHATDRTRMEHVQAAWRESLADPYLPRTLGPRLRRAGFEVRRPDVVPLLNTEWTADMFSHGLIGLIRSFAVGRRGVTPEEAEDWAADLRRLGEAGAYFFSLNRYLFLAIKPADQAAG